MLSCVLGKRFPKMTEEIFIFKLQFEILKRNTDQIKVVHRQPIAHH